MARVAIHENGQQITLHASDEWGKPVDVLRIATGVVVRFSNKISAIYDDNFWALPYSLVHYATNWQKCEPEGFIEMGLIGRSIYSHNATCSKYKQSPEHISSFLKDALTAPQKKPNRQRAFDTMPANYLSH